MTRHSGSSGKHPCMVLVTLLLLTAGGTLQAKEEGAGGSSSATKKQEGVRVDDLPKPIPGFMKSIQQIGNQVGEGISKATSEGARAVKKAVTPDQEKQDDKE